MEPITVATAFASIVGLIRMYKAEVQEHEGRVFDGYIKWLRRQEHKQLVDLILGNDVLAQSVRDLIEDQHGEVMAKLESLDKIITGVARHIGTFQSLRMSPVQCSCRLSKTLWHGWRSLGSESSATA